MNFENSFLLFIISVLMRFKEEKYGNLYKKKYANMQRKDKIQGKKVNVLARCEKRNSFFFFFFELGLTPCKTE